MIYFDCVESSEAVLYKSEDVVDKEAVGRVRVMVRRVERGRERRAVRERGVRGRRRVARWPASGPEVISTWAPESREEGRE